MNVGGMDQACKSSEKSKFDASVDYLDGKRRKGEQRVVICPKARNSHGKLWVMPDNIPGSKVRFRLGRRLRTTSLLVGQWPTKAMMVSGRESVARHTGTETLPRHLRVAAVENLRQWTKV
eukprot:TRINITY_DN18603_c0_g1_i7.p2 TRINITY_DN18603_c0_g1~~TRINITY_DN18603_c0_g1_i7.p2  ORF type:complete len:120 (-),score=5.39 TRINITY_DN18603_c0_g1_i7:5-364(-)